MMTQPVNINPLIMGILNVTPDSFYDGGLYCKPQQAYDRAMAMIDEGADIIDIGGESSRPGATPITVDEELERVIPVIQRIRNNCEIDISIDTYKPQVMRAALTNGATFVNDIMALRVDGALSVLSEFHTAKICLMHMQGMPQTMQIQPTYDRDIIDEINDFFQTRIKACTTAGIARERLILDPGFGFGKNPQHNLTILQRLSEFKRHQLPILLGISQKRSLQKITTNINPTQTSITLAIHAISQGASIIRTHNIQETIKGFYRNCRGDRAAPSKCSL